MAEFDQTQSSQTRIIRILCVDDPAVKLYAEAGDLVSAWSAKSGVKVEVVILPWDKYPDTIFSTLKSGSTEFDIVMLPGYFWLPGFVANKWLSPLSDLAANNPVSWQDYDYEDILSAMRKELEIDGVVYLLPSFSEVQIVYYRKDLLKKAGFQKLTSPVSMDTWFDVAKKTHEPTNNVFGTHFKGSATESMVEWLPFYSSAGGTLPDGNNERCLPENVAIDSLNKLISFLPFCRKDVGESDNATLYELLTTGKVGIVNHWSGQLGPIMDANINPQASQYGFASLENPWGTVWAFGIPSSSNNKEDAFSCLLHLTGASADILQGKYSGSPARRSSFNNSQAASAYPWFPALLECIERKNTFPGSPKFSDLMGDLYNMSHKVVSGEQTPVEAIQELNRKLELE